VESLITRYLIGRNSHQVLGGFLMLELLECAKGFGGVGAVLGRGIDAPRGP